MTSRARKLCEGWLEYKPDHWQQRWVVLRGDIMFIFISRDTAEKQQHCGTLPIGPHTRVVCRKDCNQQTGYKFDVETDRHCIRFKSKKSSERELWRGYILGVANGVVPSNIDLLDEEIEIMKRELEMYRQSESQPAVKREMDMYRQSEGQSALPNRHSLMSADSGVGEDMISLGQSERGLPCPCRASNDSGSGSSGSRRTSIASSLPDGGPTLVHKFYEKTRDQTPPSWFFSSCSRELSEKILEAGRNRDRGNTLMRESTSHMKSGSYVISKAVWDRRSGKCSYEHYEVIQGAKGYKVNVENEHEPMSYLTQVMEYFVKTTSGSSMPMSTNDLRQLGVERGADYDRIIKFQGGEPWVWPPPDYDETELPRQWPADPSDDSPRSHTVTPRTSDKRVGWSPNTVAAPHRPRPKPTMSEMGDRTQAAERLQQFDEMIGQYDQQPLATKKSPQTSSVGHTESSVKTHPSSASSIPSPPPPPPPHPPLQTLPTRASPPASTPAPATKFVIPVAPPPPPAPLAPPAPSTPLAPPVSHKKTLQHSYVDAGADERLIDSLPVAPPAPRVPLGNGPTSTPSRPQSTAGASTPTSPSLRKNHPVRSSISVETTTGSGGGTPAWKQKRYSQPNITGSPDKLPTWSNSKQSPNSPVTSPSSPRGDYDDTVFKKEKVEAGVDDHNQGGVNDLRSRFEKKISVGSTTPVEKRSGVSRTARPHKSMSAVELSSHMVDDIYELVPADYDDADIIVGPANSTNITNPSLPHNPSKHSSTNIRHSVSCMNFGQQASPLTSSKRASLSSMTSAYVAEDIYDDTAVEIESDVHRQSGVKKVTIQENPPKVSTPVAQQQRRQSEPAVSMIANTPSDKTDGAGKLQGLNQDFKNKLEGLFGGATPSGGPLSPTARQHPVHHENVYEELPEIIPDEVTYVNEQYNK